MASRRLSSGFRRASMVVAMLLACGSGRSCALVGLPATPRPISGRWTPTPEERLLAQADDEPWRCARTGAMAEPDAPSRPGPTDLPHQAPILTRLPRSESGFGGRRSDGTLCHGRVRTEADWPGFRGAEPDSIVRGVRIDTDWAQKPPVELWRRPIGPGWSSFSVRGDLIYTQEQRGDDEVVSLQVDNRRAGVATSRRGPFLGVEWRRRSARDADVHNGRVYTMGATGIVNALDAASGAVVGRAMRRPTPRRGPGLGRGELAVGD